MPILRNLLVPGAGTVGLGIAAAAFSAARAPLGDKIFTFVSVPANLLLPQRVANGILGKVRMLTQADHNMRRLEMGGRYQDSDTARMFRSRAVEAMSGSLGSARRYLGNEAAMLHR